MILCQVSGSDFIFILKLLTPLILLGLEMEKRYSRKNQVLDKTKSMATL